MVKLCKNYDRPNQPAPDARFTRRTPGQTRFENQNLSLRYKRARIYSAQLGRFISRDPLDFVDGMSLYRAYFVPTRQDPWGNSPQDERAEVDAVWKDFIENSKLYRDIIVRGCPIKFTYVPDCSKLNPPVAGGAGGVALPGGQVYICGDRLPNADGSITSIREVMRHEMVHVYDECVWWPEDPSDCFYLACTELRAYDYEGACREHEEFSQEHRNCLAERAFGSLQGGKFPKGCTKLRFGDVGYDQEVRKIILDHIDNCLHCRAEKIPPIPEPIR